MTYFKPGDKIGLKDETEAVGVVGLTPNTIYTVESFEIHGGFVVIINDRGFYKSYNADRFSLYLLVA